MRVAICGKGGAGKTTISASLARFLGQRGLQVIALDGDPNPNLAAALGVAPAERARLRRVPREEVMEERTDLDGSRHLHLKRPFEEVLTEYALTAPDNVVTLSMTGLLGAGRG